MEKIGRSLTSKAATIIFRLIVAFFFVLPGVLKVMAPWQEFATVIAKYEILPVSVIPIYAQVLPWVEIVFGILLVLRMLPIPTLILLGGMLVMFEVATISTYFRGIDISECGCFAGLNIPDSPPITIIRDLFLLAMLYAIFVFERRQTGLDDHEEENGDDIGTDQ